MPSYFLIREASKLNTVSLTGELELISDCIDLVVFSFTSDFIVDESAPGAHLPIRDNGFLEVLARVLFDS